MSLVKSFSIAFLVANAAAMALNTHTFSKLDDDAVAINLAGRQRMLTQRMTKSALQAVEQGNANAAEDMRKAASLFDATLRAFVQGGKTTAADGTAIEIPALTGEAHAIAAKALTQWEPLARVLMGSAGDTYAAKDVLLAANVDLLNLMNAMTVATEKASKSNVTILRYAQGGLFALALALGIMVFIALARQAKTAQSDSDSLYHTLDLLEAGVLIVDQDGKIRYHNVKALKLLDLDGGSAIGKAMTSFMDDLGGGMWKVARLGKVTKLFDVSISRPVPSINHLRVVTMIERSTTD